MKTVQEINDELLLASGLSPALVKMGDDLINAVVGLTSNDEDDDDEECQHDEHDHGYCLDCGEDIMNNLVGQCEDSLNGDR